MKGRDKEKLAQIFSKFLAGSIRNRALELKGAGRVARRFLSLIDDCSTFTEFKTRIRGEDGIPQNVVHELVRIRASSKI